MHNLTIRKAHLDDLDELANLARATFSAAFKDLNDPEFFNAYLAEAFSTEKVAQEMQEPNGHFFIAEHDGSMVAYAKLKIAQCPSCIQVPNVIELERIYVASDQTSLGIGWQLMNQMVEEAVALGFDYMWLGAWKENRRAAEFYQKFGFEIVGEKVFMLGQDAQEDNVFLLDISSK